MSHKAGRLTPLKEIKRTLYGMVADSFIDPMRRAAFTINIYCARRREVETLRAEIERMAYGPTASLPGDMKQAAWEVVERGSGEQVQELAREIDAMEYER